jgi:hypothetical protein
VTIWSGHQLERNRERDHQFYSNHHFTFTLSGNSDLECNSEPYRSHDRYIVHYRDMVTATVTLTVMIIFFWNFDLLNQPSWPL